MGMQIGQTAELLGMTADTLRYYEKIKLVPRAAKNLSGRREYAEDDLARLRFVQRAQSIGFSLDEIAHLLILREDPGSVSRETRTLAEEKCRKIEDKLRTLKKVHSELTLLLGLCSGDGENCPIIDRLDCSC